MLAFEPANAVRTSVRSVTNQQRTFNVTAISYPVTLSKNAPMLASASADSGSAGLA